MRKLPPMFLILVSPTNTNIKDEQKQLWTESSTWTRKTPTTGQIADVVSLVRVPVKFCSAKCEWDSWSEKNIHIEPLCQINNIWDNFEPNFDVTYQQMSVVQHQSVCLSLSVSPALESHTNICSCFTSSGILNFPHKRLGWWWRSFNFSFCNSWGL